jgi:hypothetical protein
MVMRSIRFVSAVVACLVLSAWAGLALAEDPVLDPGGPGAASNLKATCSCSPETGEPVASLSWDPAQNPGSEQRIEVTIYDWDRADRSSALAADATSFEWTGLHGQAIHEWRVLTLQPEGWVPSNKASFEGPTCTRDGID